MLKIAHIYPDALNLYGDNGNILCLKKRCEWRGIDVEVVPFALGQQLDFDDADIVFLGGGADFEQKIAAKHLRDNKSALREYAEDGGVLLAVCGSYQLLGRYYRTADYEVEGLSILDIYTNSSAPRLTGNAVIKSELIDCDIVGFENHAGRTNIGSHTPFGKVVHGFGNNGESGCEGVVYKNVIGTYLHGPLLPKNPKLADFLIKKAIFRKNGDCSEFKNIDDTFAEKALRDVVEALKK